MALHVGTSGFAYKEWKPDFYPADLPQARFLDHYGRVLTACEINATFYRLQGADTIAGWASRVPAGFRFAAKAHRGLTHGRAWPPGSDDGGAFLHRFLDTLAGFGDRLGAVLIQFPPYRRRDDDGLRDLMATLPPGTPFALEFRHESWEDPAVAEAVAAGGGTVCLSDTTGDVPEALPPGPRAYVRLRAERYTPEARDGWRDLLAREAITRDVFAFAKHEGVPAGDPFAGVGLAEWLCLAAAEHRRIPR
ncbi:MAG: DUF72 domain-containing protein [Actinomycetota bacterium]